MKKSALFLAFLTICISASFSLSSCGNKKANEEEKEAVEESKIENRTVDLSIFSAMPLNGDQAEYFSFSAPDSSQVIKLMGVVDNEESTISSKGTIKADIQISIVKPLNDEIVEWTSYSGPKLAILDENHEELVSLSLNKTDREILQKELEKAQPGSVNLIFKTEEYEKNYNNIFNKAKYVQLKGLDFKTKSEQIKEEKEREAELAKEEREARKAEAASPSYSSYDSDDDEDYDDAPGGKTRWQKVKDKVKDKTKDIREKATEKIDEWLDR